MTHVLSLTELKSSIPEIKQLEGMDFSNNIRKFLVRIIDAIEKSGKYEFVQYVPQSAIFVIRDNCYLRIEDAEKLLLNHFDNGKVKNKASRAEKLTFDKNKNLALQEIDVKSIEKEEKSVSSDSKLFNDIKLPWQKF